MRRGERRRHFALAEPSRDAVERCRRWLEAVRVPRAWDGGLRWLLLTPLGRPDGWWLSARLAALGVRVRRRLAIARWPVVSTAVQARSLAPEHLRRAALLEAVWQRVAGRRGAEAWALDPVSHARLVAKKRTLRAPLNNVRVCFGPRPGDLTTLHAFHLPDLADGAVEAQWLEAALGRP